MAYLARSSTIAIRMKETVGMEILIVKLHSRAFAETLGACCAGFVL
jgi:hypothetical protein